MRWFRAAMCSKTVDKTSYLLDVFLAPGSYSGKITKYETMFSMSRRENL